eukprot:242441_1
MCVNRPRYRALQMQNVNLEAGAIATTQFAISLAMSFLCCFTVAIEFIYLLELQGIKIATFDLRSMRYRPANWKTDAWLILSTICILVGMVEKSGHYCMTEYHEWTPNSAQRWILIYGMRKCIQFSSIAFVIPSIVNEPNASMLYGIWISAVLFIEHIIFNIIDYMFWRKRQQRGYCGCCDCKNVNIEENCCSNVYWNWCLDSNKCALIGKCLRFCHDYCK